MPAALALVLASRDSKREARGPCPSPSHALCSARAGCLEAQPASGLHSGVIEAGSPALHGRRRLAWLRARNSIPMTTKNSGDDEQLLVSACSRVSQAGGPALAQLGF